MLTDVTASESHLSSPSANNSAILGAPSCASDLQAAIDALPGDGEQLPREHDPKYDLTTRDSDGKLHLSDYYASTLGPDTKEFAMGLVTLGFFLAAKHMADCYRWATIWAKGRCKRTAGCYHGRCHNPMCRICGRRWCRLGGWLYERDLHSITQEPSTLIELILHRPALEPDYITASQTRDHRDRMMQLAKEFTEKLGIIDNVVVDVINPHSREVRANVFVRGQVSTYTAKRLWKHGWVKVTVGRSEQEIKHLLGIAFAGLEPALTLSGTDRAAIFVAFHGLRLSRTPRKSDYFRPLSKTVRKHIKSKFREADIMCPCDECKGKVPMEIIPPSERKIEPVEEIEKRYDRVVWINEMPSPFDTEMRYGAIVHYRQTNEQFGSGSYLMHGASGGSPPN